MEQKTEIGLAKMKAVVWAQQKALHLGLQRVQRLALKWASATVIDLVSRRERLRAAGKDFGWVKQTAPTKVQMLGTLTVTLKGNR